MFRCQHTPQVSLVGTGLTQPGRAKLLPCHIDIDTVRFQRQFADGGQIGDDKLGGRTRVDGPPQKPVNQTVMKSQIGSEIFTPQSRCAQHLCHVLVG